MSKPHKGSEDHTDTVAVRTGTGGELPPMSADDRLAELGALQRGWLDGAGAAIAVQALVDAKAIADGMSDPDGRPGIFPMESGGVLVEQILAGHLVRSVEINPDGSFYVFDLATRRFFAVRSVPAVIDVLATFSESS